MVLHELEQDGLRLGPGTLILTTCERRRMTWDLGLESNAGASIHSHANLRFQETLNYWKQLPHILKYFRAEEDPNARRPQNFMTGFLEVGSYLPCLISVADTKSRVGTECRSSFYSFVHIAIHHKEIPRFRLIRHAMQCFCFPSRVSF